MFFDFQHLHARPLQIRDERNHPDQWLVMCVTDVRFDATLIKDRHVLHADKVALSAGECHHQ